MSLLLFRLVSFSMPLGRAYANLLAVLTCLGVKVNNLAFQPESLPARRIMCACMLCIPCCAYRSMQRARCLNVVGLCNVQTFTWHEAVVVTLP